MADPSNRWTPEEDALFRSMAEASTSPEMIAAKLNRSVHAVTLIKCRHCGAPRGTPGDLRSLVQSTRHDFFEPMKQP